MSKDDKKLRDTPSAVANGEQDLDLKPDTITLLKKKIEADLSNSKSGKPSPKTKTSSGTRARGQTQKKTITLSKSNEQQQQVSAKQKENGLAGPDPKYRGKKRLRDGQVKEPASAKSKSNGVQRNQKSHDGDILSRPRLEQEILALGGSKDDLKLIEDGESASEFESGDRGPEKSATGGLKKELLRLVQELGIEQISQEVDQTSDSNPDDSGSDAENVGMEGTNLSRKDASTLQPKQSMKKASQFVRTLLTTIHYALVAFADNDDSSKLSPLQIGTLLAYNRCQLPMSKP